MTVTWNEVLLTIATIAVVYLAVQLVRNLERVSRSASEIEKTTKQLEPRVDRFLGDASELLQEARSVLRRVDEVAADASSVSEEATRVVVPMIRDLEGLRETTRRLAALTVAVRTGYTALTRGKD